MSTLKRPRPRAAFQSPARSPSISRTITCNTPSPGSLWHLRSSSPSASGGAPSAAPESLPVFTRTGWRDCCSAQSSGFHGAHRTTGRSMSIHDDRRTSSFSSAHANGHIGVDGIADLADDFDQIALVVDWLDACRNRDLATLLDLYADDATFECRCGGGKVSKGR